MDNLTYGFSWLLSQNPIFPVIAVVTVLYALFLCTVAVLTVVSKPVPQLSAVRKIETSKDITPIDWTEDEQDL